jgi:hypothetical protein
MKTNEEYLKELNVNLSKEIPHKWRVQSFSKKKPVATVVAYIDSRNASDILNECAVYGWSDEYYEVGGNTYCKVGIVMPDGSILWKSDCGVESNQDKEKGQASDAFKRACVKWGIGRFLYNLGMEYVTASEVKKDNNWPYPIDEQGKQIWDLTEYINNRRSGSVKNTKPHSSPSPKFEQSNELMKNSTPALQPNTSFAVTNDNVKKLIDAEEDRKVKALDMLKKVKAVSTVKGLIAKQKEFKATEAGKDFVSGATIEDAVKLNSIELVGEFYKFVK